MSDWANALTKSYGEAKDTLLNTIDRVEDTIFEESTESYVLSSGTVKFEFSVLGERSINLSSEMTDYVVENNSKVQDEVSLSPIIIELSGFVGEVVEKVPRDIKYTGLIQSKLSMVAGFAPELSAQAQEQFNKLLDLKEKAGQLIDKIASAGNLVDSFFTASESAIKTAYSKLCIFWKNKTDVFLRTSFADFSSMKIINVKFVENGSELLKSDISLTLKQKTTVKKVPANNMNRTMGQKATTVNQGQMGKDESTLNKWIGW
ncbi:hypothetical protein FACS1894152_1610 [Bacilli bacterium]|nr:hypothetical protein FACS1894152_1610 [Bacilli bacterium]